MQAVERVITFPTSAWQKKIDILLLLIALVCIGGIVKATFQAGSC